MFISHTLIFESLEVGRGVLPHHNHSPDHNEYNHSPDHNEQFDIRTKMDINLGDEVEQRRGNILT